MKNIELTEDYITLIHDSKIWSMNFNFDGSQTSVIPSLVIDIDYVTGSDSSLDNDDITFHICPAKLNFNGVSSFNIKLSSDMEEEAHYKADCLYIYRIERTLTKSSRLYFKIVFSDNVGYIDLYSDKAFLFIEESKTYKIKGSDSIPILLRGSM
ncbi:TPA: hypothetical protein ACPYV0_004644 [Citrobacter amalonaticus]|nr:hypothetical protein [Citrobacter amalonaticus]